MHILFSPGSDPVLTDSRAGLEEIHNSLTRFLESQELEWEIGCEPLADPAPYEACLQGLKVVKSDGPIHLMKNGDDWLVLHGSVPFLKRYSTFLRFENDDGHHHPEYVDLPGYLAPDSMSLIIEVNAS